MCVCVCVVVGVRIRRDLGVANRQLSAKGHFLL